jgi:plastocyanin
MNEYTPTPQPESPATPPMVEQKPSRRRLWLLILLVAVLLAGVLAYSFMRSTEPDKPSDDTLLTSEAVQESAQVSITAQGFSPATIKISQGSTVTWTNTDTAAHSLKSDVPGLETEEPLSTNDQFSYMFETLGVYTVTDAGNPAFKLVIEVE